MRDARHKAAVIGASGFIGGQLLRALTGDGIECVGYTRSTPFLTDSGARYASKLFNPAFLRSKGLPTPPWLDK